MPSKQGRADRLLEDALTALVRALEESKAPWAIIGGIAIIARGVRRFTTDVDAAVRGDTIQAKRLAKLLAKHEIRPRIADALRFAEENLVLLLRHTPTGVDIDVSFAWSEFEHEALAIATPTRFGTVEARICLPESLIVFKAIAGRPKDVDDMEALLDLYPNIDRQRVRTRVAELAALAESPEMLQRFDLVLAQLAKMTPVVASSPARPRRRPAPPKKRAPKPKR
jgi:hypothetical protein